MKYMYSYKLTDYGVPFVSKFIFGRHLEKLVWGFTEIVNIYVNHSEIFDMDHRRHNILEMLQLWRFMKAVDIYVNLTGRHHINCRH